MADTETLTIHLDKKMKRLLKILAAKRGKSVADILRGFIAKAVENE